MPRITSAILSFVRRVSAHMESTPPAVKYVVHGAPVGSLAARRAQVPIVRENTVASFPPIDRVTNVVRRLSAANWGPLTPPWGSSCQPAMFVVSAPPQLASVKVATRAKRASQDG